MKELLKKILATGGLNNELSCEIEELLDQPEQDNIQYLLDQVARLTAENAMLKEKWSEPKREPLSESEIAAIWGDSDYDVAVVRRIEKAHGIGGEPLSNEQKRLEAIAIKQREAHGFGGGEE